MPATVKTLMLKSAQSIRCSRGCWLGCLRLKTIFLSAISTFLTLAPQFTDTKLVNFDQSNTIKKYVWEIVIFWNTACNGRKAWELESEKSGFKPYLCNLITIWTLGKLLNSFVLPQGFSPLCSNNHRIPSSEA